MPSVPARPESVKPTRSCPTSTSAPITRTSINGFVYALTPLAIHPAIGSAAFILDKLATRNRYVVHRDAHGEICCDCPDFTLRRSGTGRTCKHGAKLVDLGLIDPPTPIVVSLPLAVAPITAAPSLPSRHGQARDVVAPSAGRRRFVPTPEDDALAAQMFA